MFKHKFSFRVKIIYRTNYINIHTLNSVRKTTGHAPLDFYKIKTVQFGKWIDVSEQHASASTFFKPRGWSRIWDSFSFGWVWAPAFTPIRSCAQSLQDQAGSHPMHICLALHHESPSLQLPCDSGHQQCLSDCRHDRTKLSTVKRLPLLQTSGQGRYPSVSRSRLWSKPNVMLHCQCTWQHSGLQSSHPRGMLLHSLPKVQLNPPAPKVLGRDLPDGTRKRLQVYLGGGIFRPKPPVFDRSWRSPSKNTVKNSTEDTCSWTRPSKIGKRKVEKPRVFQLFDLNFLVCNICFCGSAGGRARRRIFEFLDPFSDWFSSFCDSRNTGFYSVFLFSACLTASFKTSKNLVNYAVLCYGVNENIVNTSVFWRWLKKHCKLQCFWPPDPQKPWYLQWFLLLTAQKHCK